jgi:hypothetical protein
LTDEIYVTPSAGYFELMRELESERGAGSYSMILGLLRSLYGLQQSPMIWYGTIREYLEGLGFMCSRLDGGFFILSKDGIVKLMLLIFVDDLLLIGGIALIEDIKGQFKQRFEMHDLGAATFYLEMRIEHAAD